MIKLKPCPFCGRKAILTKYKKFNGENDYQVYCPDEVIRIHTKWFNAEEKAVEAWNRRCE